MKTMKILNNKRGNYADVPYFVAIALFFGILIILVYILFSNFNNAVQNNPYTNTTVEAMTYSNDFLNKYPKAFDWVLPILYIIFIGFTVWSASLVESSNKFFFIGIFVSFLLLAFSLMMENFWEEFKTNPNIINYVTSFTFTDFMLSNLRYFVLFFIFIIMITLYSRRD